jgi:hypothetical protein
MMRLFPALFLALAMGVGCAATYDYRYRPGRVYDGNRPLAMTGCLQKAHSGGYVLTDASLASGYRDDDRGRYDRRDDDRWRGDAGWSGRIWKLEHGHDLDDHVNELVQVVGTPENDTSEIRPTRHSEKIRVRDFNVRGMRLLRPSCR